MEENKNFKKINLVTGIFLLSIVVLAISLLKPFYPDIARVIKHYQNFATVIEGVNPDLGSTDIVAENQPAPTDSPVTDPAPDAETPSENISTEETSGDNTSVEVLVEEVPPVVGENSIPVLEGNFSTSTTEEISSDNTPTDILTEVNFSTSTIEENIPASDSANASSTSPTDIVDQIVDTVSDLVDAVLESASSTDLLNLPDLSATSTIATSTATSTDAVEINRTEEITDTGKIVTISAENEKVDAPLVDILATTTIPEIYKVGQENKIKIKWSNNNDQNITFKAYDTNSNGKLDYIEWIVPHLSTQTFEIIFISKAFQLDATQNIIADIFDQTKEQDNIWATIEDGQYVRATFNSVLDDTNDITLFAKPASSSQSSLIEVYPVYTDAEGNITEGSKVATFSAIDHDGKYRIRLTDLGTPTEVFDLKFSGYVAVDYIVDPGFTSTQSGNFNIGTTWGGACASSCIAGTDYPGASDTATIANGHTITMSATSTVAGLTVNTGGILATASAGITVAGDATVNGTVSGATAMTLSGTAKTLYSTTGGTISSPITLSASYTIDVSTSTLTISGAIGGAFAITKTGASTLVLSGTNTYTGTTTISAGILQAGSATALGTIAGKTVVSDGAALDLNGQTITNAEPLDLNGTGVSSSGAIYNSSATAGSVGAGAITLISSSTIKATTGNITLSGAISNSTFLLTVDGSANTTLSGVIGNGAGGITKNGSGTLTLSGNNTYTGVTTVSVGTLKLGGAGSGANTPLGTVAGATSVTAGATLDLAGFTLATAEPLTLNGTGISSGGALMNSGSAVTYSGLVTLGSTGVSIIGGTGTIALSNAGTITGSGYNLTLGGGAGGSMASIIGTVAGTLTKADFGTWTLTNANTYTGQTNVNAGTLNIQNNSALGTTAGGTVVATGAKLQLQNGITVTGEALTLNGGDFVTATGGDTVTTYGAYTARSFTTTGTSTLTVSSGGTVDYLVVGGGGSGAGGNGALWAAGGGGAGGLITSVSTCYSGGGTPGTGSTPNSPATLTAGNYTVTVGGGGASVSGNVIGNNGQDSVFGNTGAEFAIAKGGGGGGRWSGSPVGSVGGSGGGSSSYSTAYAGGAGTAGQGFAGGGTPLGGGDNGGGGGGAGNVGLTRTDGSHGGPGLANTITGSSVVYAGGGGGSGDPVNGNGGSGGGGNYKQAGTDGKGGGGGGGKDGASGKGGSGIVIISYLASGSLENVSGDNIWTGAVTLGTNNTITTTAGNLTVSGAVGGAFALTKAGTGTLILSGNNTYTGVTTVSVGTLKLGGAGSGANTPLGTVAGATSVTAGATLDLAGFTLATAEPLTLNGTGISSGGALMNSGSAVTYSGLVTLGSTGVSIIGGTGTIALSNTGTITGSGYNLTLGGLAGGSVASIIGTVAGTLTKADFGTWTLTNANTYTGQTNVNAGTLNIQNNSALGTTAGGTVVATGAKLQLQNGITVTGEALTLNGGDTVSATGGDTVTTYGAYTARSFTTVGTSTLSVTTGGTVDYLVIAGGGAGGGGSAGNGAGGGGGAGGYRSSVSGESSGGGASAESPLTVTAQNYSIVVGAGGTAVTGDVVGNNGQDSSFSTITSIGGGGGAKYTGTGNNGGSGGGSSNYTAATGTSGQGFNGGIEGRNNNGDVGASGGGAGAVGGNTTSSPSLPPGPGGVGVASSITGTSIYRGGGGAGGMWGGTGQGQGGNGGGGNGGNGAGISPTSGTANTGGGGGGASRSTSGAGGSGTVIVRYLASGALENVSGDNTWTGAVTLGTNNTITTTAGNLTVSGAVGGAFALTKAGTSTLILSGNNTYSGGTTINAGTLSISADVNLGSTAVTNPVTFNGGALTRSANFAITTTRGFVVNAGGGTINLSGSTGITFGTANTLTGSGTLTVHNTSASANSFSATASQSTFNGKLIIDNGRLVQGAGYLGSAGSGWAEITLQNGGNISGSSGTWANNFRLSGTGEGGRGVFRTTGQTINGTVTLIGTTTIGSEGSQTINGNISGDYTLTLGGGPSGSANNTIVLAGTNSQTATVINVGIIQISSDRALGTTTTPVTIANDATLQAGAANIVLDANRPITLAAGGTVFFDTNSYIMTINSTIQNNTGSLSKIGAGTLILSNTNNFTGSVEVAGGTLKLGAADKIPDGTGKGAFSVSSGATLDLNGFNETVNGLFGGGTITNGASSTTSTLTVGNADSDGAFSGVIQNGSGTTALTKTGAGTQLLSGSSTYTGTTTVSAGTLGLGFQTTPGTGALYQLDATQLSTFFQDTGGTNPVTTAGQSVALWKDYTNTVENFSQATENYRPTYQTGSINGLPVVRFDGPGANDDSLAYTGAVSPLLVFIVNKPTALGGNDGIFGLNSSDTGIRYGSGSWTNSGLNGDTLFFINGVRTGSFTVGQSQLFEFTGSNSSMASNAIGNYFSGGATRGMSGDIGEVVVYNSYASTASRFMTRQYLTDKWFTASLPSSILPDSSPVVVSGGATLDFRGKTETVGSLSGAGTVTSSVVGSITITAGNDGTNTNFSGVIQNGSGTVALTKAGGGIFTLSGTNTYSGLTTASAGTLAVTNSSALGTSSMTLGASGTLDASGVSTLNISGNWTNSGGTFTPGTNAVAFIGTNQKLFGTTTFYNLTKDISAGSADTLCFQQSNTQSISANGTLTLKGASGKVLTLRGCDASGNLTSGDPKWILNVSSTSTNIVADFVDVRDSDASPGRTIAVTNFTNTGNNLNWSIAPNVPILISPANASYTNNTTPTLSANYSDPDTGDTGTTNFRIATSSANCLAGTVIVSGTSSESASNNATTTWTPGSSIGSDGTYYWCAQNNDGVLTSAWTSMGNFILDTVAPTNSISTPSATSTNTGPITYTVTYSGADSVALANGNITLNKTGTATGTAVVSGTGTSSRTVTISSISGDGTLGISIVAGTASDTAGNTSLSAGPSTTFTVDTTAPSTTDNSDTSWHDTDQTITLTPNDGTGSGIAHTYYCIDTDDSCTPTTEGVSVSVTCASSSTCQKYVRYNSVDNLGNTESVKTSNIVKVDKEIPAGGSISYTDGFYAVASVPITYSVGSDLGSGLNNASGKIQRASATLSGGTCGVFGSFLDLITEYDGSYTDTVSNENCYQYQYVISDNVGNTATSTSLGIAKIDTGVPTTIDDYANDNVWMNGGQTITLTPTCGVSGCEWTKYCLTNSCDPASGTIYSAPVSVSTEGTTYFRYASKNNSGSVQTTQQKIVRVDTTAPASFGISSIVASTTALTVLANATDAGAGLHATPYFFNETVRNTDSGWQASDTFVDTGLTPNTLYTYKVKAKDTFDQVSDYSATSSKYTLAEVPATSTLVIDSASQITVNLGTSTNPVGTEYFISNTNNSTNSGWIINNSWISSGLTCNTEYAFAVKARNADGVETATSTASSKTAVCPANSSGGVYGYLPPSPQVNSTQGFTVQINDGSYVTNNQDVVLILRGSPDTVRMSISNDVNFTNAIQESYNIVKSWRLSDGEGVKTIYVRFYSPYGVSSSIIKAYVYYQSPSALNPIINFINPPVPPNTNDITPIPPQPPVEKVVTEEAPDSLKNIWNLLPTETINDFALKPVPQDIAVLVHKLPGLERALKELGFSNITDITKLVNFSLRLPTLAEITNPSSTALNYGYVRNQPGPSLGVLNNLPIGQLNSNTNIPFGNFISLRSGEITTKQNLPSDSLNNLSSGKLSQGPNIPAGDSTNLQSGKISPTQNISSDNLSSGKMTNPTIPSGSLANLESGKFAAPQGIPVKDLTDAAKMKIPSEIVFAKSSDGLVDYNIDLSLNEKGQPQERVNVLANNSFQLIVKPDSQARAIRGYMLFKQNNFRGAVKNKQAGLTASVLAAVFDGKADADQVQKLTDMKKGLVVSVFDYADDDKDGLWTADVKAPVVDGEYEIISVIDYLDRRLQPKELSLITVVDPEGYVYTNINGGELRIKSAKVTIYQLNTETKEYQIWPAKDYQQSNPQVTNSTGKYSFLVPEGTYNIQVETDGYADYKSEDFDVRKDIGVHFNIELKPKNSLLNALDWRTVAVIIFMILISLLYYRDRKMRKDLLVLLSKK